MISEFLKAHFIKQKMMRTVIVSLIPLILTSIYFFGWRSLILLMVVTIFGISTEWIYEKKQNKKISEAILVTCILYTLTLPARTPFWIASIGIVFGVFFAKEVFGGFGRNLFNPALVARAFVYISFPEPLTAQWSIPAVGFPGGFVKYLTKNIDVLSQSTPMLTFRETGFIEPLDSLLLGNVAGSLGETSAILIIIAGIYLLYKKVAAWQTMTGVIAGFMIANTVFYILGSSQIPNPIFGILSGGFLFGTVFMVTDPISSPKTKGGKWIYGILIGIVTVIIRGYALFAGGMMFSILIGNTFAPIIDEGIKYVKKMKKEKREEVTA
ncbi:RnfABCDGE type electron transport complex subunit D [Schnuerera sp. xch1]|uniref:RnfABCDGE type electron transport complex subunit D n=1 Tax=Schnuerera sp. xch1 TaxID=2874283 RepID=UPI001CBF569A|nr:RnfABCDGE type electron transport complex subunit D [Schnuerera sp. xch1]MBZ2174419.1 RnfABCDGE type electron transport complex subunit D [Schnuerera sp. xch1]